MSSPSLCSDVIFIHPLRPLDNFGWSFRGDNPRCDKDDKLRSVFFIVSALEKLANDWDLRQEGCPRCIFPDFTFNKTRKRDRFFTTQIEISFDAIGEHAR